MAENVTVVRATDSNGRPTKVVKFKDVTMAYVNDGHLCLESPSAVLALFPPGGWASFHRDEKVVLYGRQADSAQAIRES